MNKKLLEQMREKQKEHEIGYVIFYNDGTIGTEEYGFKDKLDTERFFPFQTKMIMEQFGDGIADYAKDFSFDTVCMDLKLGLVYNASDIDGINHIKEGAKPIKNIVRYYTSSINSYLDGNQTNTRDFTKHHWEVQGFVNYNKLVSTIKKGGLDFIGPNSFDEFKEAITNNNQFDIIVSAYLDNNKTNIKR